MSTEEIREIVELLIKLRVIQYNSKPFFDFEIQEKLKQKVNSLENITEIINLLNEK
jgi:hypothetical protein